MLKIQNLKKSYGKRTILNNVNMNIPKGKVYALIGPNGAGKSTIMKILTGLVSKTSGSIIFEGREWSRRDLRKIGSIIEEPPLYKNLSAYDNMKVVTTMLGVSESTIFPLLNKVGLGNIDKRPVKQFSLGMKQRLAIAISLINSPKLLILDEPTNGLDPIGIQELREIIESFKSEGMTIMISSHILSEVEHLADFIGFIYEGKIVLEKEYDGSENLEELFNNQILFEKRR
ncbi:TPA: lantibiotic protection ABC transporter ATP-binding protein [Streptococcus pyogenes]|uniref:lantibiotic protection ABC transporter ATP-binding protein n=1 Tax=Streptococcus pyogenes TaxID=1314 RepID=UPI000D706BD1|nr:lantibiotic protection ABC transporter ATP-binding protein [Streptococcus pyogenes]HER4805763.1 lantibiotic protection ABC transporter ATP-binding protein [Streptococcus pyogenes NGAS057]PWU73135.1 lantibiotic ABC transporter ATP-binding protein [Streptococcus pyogenes]QCK42351.1 lantibiotic protection ABC transporter ATP-binding protein [Streptococcus pyogenes]VGQ62181.1 lantibiotic ABC transporter ATP-binding protein [Streptococcus pyogenes]VGR51789.1 lantibiotic ABC transporter ATP-bindi